MHALDVSGLQHAAVTFSVVTEGDTVLGCVALKELDATRGELKSMRTDAAARGRGLGRLLLEHVLAVAAARGYTRMSLKTGSPGVLPAGAHPLRPLRIRRTGPSATTGPTR